MNRLLGIVYTLIIFANTKNLKASLSYASLLASTIDGDRTDIQVSYSPVVVQKWNYGQLKTDYSDQVDLREVKQLRLNSVSSNVTIGRLEDKVFVTNNLGALQINSVDDGFSNIDRNILRPFEASLVVHSEDY